MMPNFVKQIVFLLIALSLMIGGVEAKPLANSDNSDFYYEIGGARSISVPANVDVKMVSLSAAAEFGLGYSCGKFDPTLGLSNILNGLSSAGSSLINGAVGAVTSAIGSLPALVMQRIDPGLYDLFQNALIRAEATLALANKTCEQNEQDIRNGKNPHEQWTRLSKVIDWKVQMGTGCLGSSKTDVVTAKQTVEKNNGDKGSPWLGGKRYGGKSQKPIRITHDLVLAGYNLTLNRKADNINKPSYAGKKYKPRMVEIFESPADAAKWAVDVLGDTEIRTKDNSIPKTVPGYGLRLKIAKNMAAFEKKLTDIVSGKIKPTIKNLVDVSSNAVLINKDVIESIQSLEPSEQQIAISKLASEAAMANTVEKALTVRRLIITGRKEPNIKLTDAAQPAIDELVAQLDRDIDDVLYERRIHKELASETAATLLKLKHAKEQRTRQTTLPAAGAESKFIEDGGVK